MQTSHLSVCVSGVVSNHGFVPASSKSLIEAYQRVTSKWELRPDQAASLIGMPAAEYASLSIDSFAGFTPEQTKRLIACLQVYAFAFVSRLIVGKNMDWLHNPADVDPFAGASPISYMISGGLPSVMLTIKYIKTEYGAA
ncbi:MAG: hypothetical protein AAF950_09370 [Pseudomonadota bacterium]